jgi:hypothetical protein
MPGGAHLWQASCELRPTVRLLDSGELQSWQYGTSVLIAKFVHIWAKLGTNFAI